MLLHWAPLFLGSGRGEGREGKGSECFGFESAMFTVQVIVHCFLHGHFENTFICGALDLFIHCGQKCGTAALHWDNSVNGYTNYLNVQQNSVLPTQTVFMCFVWI